MPSSTGRAGVSKPSGWLPSPRDGLAALALTVGVVAGSALIDRAGPTVRPLDAAGAALLVLAGGATAYRRRFPIAVMVVTGGAAVGYYGLLYPGIFGTAGLLLAVYTAVSHGRRTPALGVAAGFLAAMYGATAVAVGDPAPPAVFEAIGWIAGWLVAVFAIGEVVRQRRRETDRRLAEADRARETAVARRADEERLWIAQRLHDSLTHHISVMNVQAGVAAHLYDGADETTRRALQAIRESGAEAMTELRDTLGLLREAEPSGPDGLARLPALVSRAAGTGLDVTAHTLGEPTDPPAPVDAAAYRIAREAVTNILRHAGATTVTVTVEYRPDLLLLTVDNDGLPVPVPERIGMGLMGIREQALAVDGTAAAGPRPGGGFRVHAELPVVAR